MSDRAALVTGWGIGGIIAMIVLVLAIIFMAVGKITLIVGLLIAGLAIARLL